MEKKYVLLTLFVFVFLLTNIFDGVGFCLRVIPNASWQQGFGIDTSAGSGRHLATPSTTVIKVTNLNDSGAGSLRDALVNQDSPKVIIFEVSGNIELQSPIWVGGRGTAEAKGSYITIAGQTAPSPGITLKDYGIVFDRNCHDILIQHVRIRPGDTSIIALGCPDCTKDSIADPLTFDCHYSVEKGWTPPYNIVVDHCSISWGGDMNIQSGADNITFSNNIISEGLNNPSHPKGPHSRGSMAIAYNAGAAGGQNLAFIQNILAHNEDRNPFIATGFAVIANNIIYDFKFGISVDDSTNDGGPIKASIVGNYIISTDLENYCIYLKAGVKAESRIYFGDDNYYSGSVQTDPWNSERTTCFEQRRKAGETTSDVPEANRASSPPVWSEGYTTMPIMDVKDYVLLHTGARPADRDSVDMRIVNDVKNGTGGIIASQNDVGGWPNLAKNTRTLTVPSNPNEVQASGYTKLEEWLHEFSRTVEGKPGRPGTLTY